ncbi:Uncharacterized protein TCM_024017 [Theobroma cacao]|uniref:Uncharacterized protein n=1 Tax=Theobroma cacao TaxID=3641 RepID=A0A061EUR3_THECC|nr:Uncharacterized protein TCM_024017 [Theobroma cacao]
MCIRHCETDFMLFHDLGIAGLPNVKLMVTYGGHWVDDTYKGGETRVRGVGSDLSFSGLVKLVQEVVGVNSHSNEIELHALLNHTVGVSCAVIRDDEDVESILRDKRNSELEDDCEDDYVGEHDDYSEDDKDEHNDISDCNHVDGSTEHARTVVLEDVQCDDHATTIKLEDVEGANLIYDSPIALENGIRSPDDSNQERLNAGLSCQWIIPGVDMISFQIVTTKESRLMDNHLYRRKVFPSKAKCK